MKEEENFCSKRNSRLPTGLAYSRDVLSFKSLKTEGITKPKLFM